MGARGLKAKIAINITVFLLIGMISIDIVTMLTAQRVLVKGEISRGQSLARILQDHLSSQAFRSESLEDGSGAERLAATLSEAGIDCFYLLNRNLQHLGIGSRACADDSEMLQQTQQALSADTDAVSFAGSTLGLLWPQAERVIVSAPLRGDAGASGAFSLVLGLEPGYRALRRTHHSLLLYVGVNTIVLAFLGIYRVFKMYLQPLARLARRAEEYKDEDELLFSVRKEDNELLRLSSALNGLMRRLTGERTKLRESVTSLEAVNRELKKAQDDVVRAEKLALVGRLSAGIAHEIGNPLGIVTGYLSLLKQTDPPDPERRDFLARAECELERIHRIIRQLLEIARPSPEGLRPVSVHRVLSELEQTLRLQPVMARVRTSTRLEAATDTVMADPDRLRQVFLNLALNAADALAAHHPGGGGELSILTAVSRGTSSGEPVDGWLEVRFEDNGPGIAPEVLPFVFDPFFTTKEPGKGTGLGLSVSCMIVQGFGGTLQAGSTPGHGTSMIVRLPLRGSPVRLAADASCPASRPVRPTPLPEAA